MGLFSRSGESNPRTGQHFRSEAQMWTDLAADADRRAAGAQSEAGRKAMEKNARDFRRNACKGR
jgi:hypothetical protein